MVIPEYLRQITPLSKALAMGLFIILPFAGFGVGRMYQAKIQPKEIYVTREKIVKVFPTESQDEIARRCGELPLDSVLEIKEGMYATDISGPYWSPDCRNITWSDNSGAKPAGIYLYNEKSGKIQLGLRGKDDENIRVTGWKDSKNILFEYYPEKERYIFNIFDRTQDSYPIN